jgi:hypothetical protein
MDHDEGARLAPTAPPPERDGTSVCHVVHHEGSGKVHFSRETVERLLAGGEFFWLDLYKPTPGDFEMIDGGPRINWKNQNCTRTPVSD